MPLLDAASGEPDHPVSYRLHLCLECVLQVSQNRALYGYNGEGSARSVSVSSLSSHSMHSFVCALCAAELPQEEGQELDLTARLIPTEPHCTPLVCGVQGPHFGSWF